MKRRAARAPRVKAKLAGSAVAAARFQRRINRIVNATYDAAQTTDRNESLWATASGRTADAEATPAVRATIRNRCRYEARNNSYCRGIIDTKANDVCGRMPYANLVGEESEALEAKELEFAQWAEEIHLGQKARLAFLQREESGEAFLVFKHNPDLRSRVKIDVIMVEPDRVCAMFDKPQNPNYYDGITYDSLGNPVSYDILRYHPGGPYTPDSLTGAYDTVPAREVIHFFRQTRPGMRRGVPDIAPALNLFGQLRRFTLATLTAAEAAANAAWMLVSKNPNVEPMDVDPEQSLSVNPGSGITMPAGWGIEQIDSKHPNTTYADFKRQLLNEICRCLNMPMNVGLADSSDYNYASGRLDYQIYFRDVMINRYDLSTIILDAVYRAWDKEWRMASGAIPGEPEGVEWFFDGTEHVDPVKEANATQIGLANRSLTYREVFARRGIGDWRKQLNQSAVEIAYLKSLGIEPGSKEAAAVAAAVALDRLEEIRDGK